MSEFLSEGGITVSFLLFTQTDSVSTAVQAADCVISIPHIMHSCYSERRPLCNGPYKAEIG